MLNNILTLAVQLQYFYSKLSRKRGLANSTGYENAENYE